VYFPTQPLFEFIYRSEWDMVISRLLTHPKDAKLTDQQNMTALHIVCKLSCPPLHLIDTIISTYPEAVIKQDRTGCTPLHYASVSLSVDVVRRLLVENISAIGIKNFAGYTSLESMYWYGPYCHDTNYEVKDAAERHINITTIAINTSFSHNQAPTDFMSQVDFSLSKMWTVVNLLLKAEYHRSISDPLPNNKVWRVVHACAGIRNCPSNLLLMFAIKLYPMQVFERDEDGNLPLHIAATIPVTSDDRGNENIRLLAAVYPGAARTTCHKGKLPLSLVLQSGYGWDKGIEDILRAYPAALTVKDEETNLFPFMAAAVSDAPLETIYKLLRANPEIGRFMVFQQEDNNASAAEHVSRRY